MNPPVETTEVAETSPGLSNENYSGLAFGLVIWCQGKIVSESGYFTPLYQGRYSNFQELDHLTFAYRRVYIVGS